MRLEQNLQDVQDLVPALNENTDEIWYRATSALQTNPKPSVMRCPYRCKPREYRDRLYHLGKFAEAKARIVVASTAGDGDDSDGNVDDHSANSDANTEADQASKALRCFEGLQKAFQSPSKGFKGLCKALSRAFKGTRL